MKRQTGSFPFGSPLRLVQQADRRPKRVFVLGVYASAVHARWLGVDGRQLVKAMAVASEPSIFWRGAGAAEVIDGIELPAGVGKLVPAHSMLNGPSGIALDELFLEPMGLSRDDAWLSDLVPHACLNPGQAKAIARAYQPFVESHGLPEVTLPPVPSRLASPERQDEIALELAESGADTLILLGDQPIRWFLKRWNPSVSRLAQLGDAPGTYGLPREMMVAGAKVQVLALAHPRQAARLGRASARWHELHSHWTHAVAPSLLR